MRYVKNRFLRNPLSGAAVFLLCLAMSAVLCGLYRKGTETQQHFAEIYRDIQVRCTLTNLTGTQSQNLKIYLGTISLFIPTEETTDTSLIELLEDVQIKGSTRIRLGDLSYTLTGISSTQAASALRPENGCTIVWNEGYDESVFAGDVPCCLIPYAMEEDHPELFTEEGISVHLDCAEPEWGADYDGVLPVAGVYISEGDSILYCPWSTYDDILRTTLQTYSASSLSAKLIHNDDLALLRETAARWFAEPDPQAGDTSAEYAFALDINDSQLQQAQYSLENSMRIYDLSSALIFLLSMAGGVLTGCLTVRSRKREIALMRTLGTSDRRIYGCFAAEQMGFVLLGTALGGAFFRFSPISRLLLFAAVYFAGLSLFLLIYLRKNLLITIKEDE